MKLEIYTETVTRRKTQNKERPSVVQYYSSQQLQFSIEKAARSGIEAGQRREKTKSKILPLGKISRSLLECSKTSWSGGSFPGQNKQQNPEILKL